jgi:hypothetical protein
VRDYLGLSDIDKVSWQFVDAADVPPGPWKLIVTSRDKSEWFKPGVNTTWQLQLQGTINTNYDVNLYIVDLFDTPQEVIDRLRASGKRVICYFSAGTYEDWRPDAEKFQSNELGKDLENWEGERWIDIRSSNVRKILQERLMLAKSKGCDGVDPDNVNGYTNDTEFDLTAEDQLDFNKFIANEAHSLGLAVGLKNDVDQAGELVAYFDFSVVEECHEYNECSKLAPFTNEGKPVFNVEYAPEYVNDPQERQALCNDAKNRHFQTLVLPLELDDSFRYSCNDTQEQETSKIHAIQKPAAPFQNKGLSIKGTSFRTKQIHLYEFFPHSILHK